MSQRPRILREDWAAALQHLGGMVDVTVEDLQRIFDLALDEAEKRNEAFHSKERVEEIMKSPVFCCSTDTSVEAAVEMLLSKNLHCLPVVKAGGKLVGIVTETDLVFQFSSKVLGTSMQGLFSRRQVRKNGQKIGDIMTRKIITVQPEDPIQAVIRLMLRHGHGRIPVVDRDKMLVGIVTRKDILVLL